MYRDLSIPEKIQNVVNDSFDQLNDLKRNYLYNSGSEGVPSAQTELNMLKAVLQLELSIRKIQKLNSASIYIEKEKEAENEISIRSIAKAQ